MFKPALTTLAAAAMLSLTAVAQASSTFPSTAVEGSESAFRMTTASTLSSGGTTMAIVTPSSGTEGSEINTRLTGVTVPRLLQSSYAGSQTSVFPESSME
ncbi:MAG: hypothetical protein K2W84_16120 [Burkholderiales bacterium]|nr:hypothetical protein [Burkholderiales bacterium]